MALRELGKTRTDGRQDPLEVGPIQLITNPDLRPQQSRQLDPDLTAGTTFLGQFIDHDITLDQSSRLGTPTPQEQTPNGRTAALDLDSVYGPGLLGESNLRDTADPAKMRWWGSAGSSKCPGRLTSGPSWATAQRREPDDLRDALTFLAVPQRGCRWPAEGLSEH